MLMDLANSKPKDMAHAVREFAGRTAMLRDCGFGHIGAMLTPLLSADVQEGPMAIPSILGPTTAAGADPSSLTEKHAIAIGSAIASGVEETRMLATALKKVFRAHAVLQVMKSENAWFVPMLEVLIAHKVAKPRESVRVKRLGSRVAAVAPLPTIADGADEVHEESGFSSVVRLVARKGHVYL
jgi:hypothetical protein